MPILLPDCWRTVCFVIAKFLDIFVVLLMLWHCWLGGSKGIWPVKSGWRCAGVGICLGWGVDLHMAQLMPLPPTISCFSKIQISFIFLVPAHLGSPGQSAIKWVLLLFCCADRSVKGNIAVWWFGRHQRHVFAGLGIWFNKFIGSRMAQAGWPLFWSARNRLWPDCGQQVCGL